MENDPDIKFPESNITTNDPDAPVAAADAVAERPGDEASIDEWLRAHSEATVPAPDRPDAPAPAWDPRTATWVEAVPALQPNRLRDRSSLRPLIAAGIVGAIVAGIVAVPVARWTAPKSSTTVQRIVTGLPASQARTSSVVSIAARARPWVVNINVGSTQPSVFGDVQVQGTGSGIILRPDGHILTNAHVVADAGAIEVTLASGDKVPAKVIGIDPETDIAVIKVDRANLPSAVIGSVKDLQVGGLVVAIGSPLGLEQSVTAGIVSALGRRVDRQNRSPLVDMIQTDAAVTQGNSGGALIDGDGAVVGVNAAIAASPDVGAEGVAFAIPIDIGVAIAEELINSGKATHPWLGIDGSNITPEVAKQYGAPQGAFIQRAVSGGPAAVAGIQANDVIVSFAGTKIDSMDDLIVAIREHEVGERVDVGVVRGGKHLTVKATLGDKPLNQA